MSDDTNLAKQRPAIPRPANEAHRLPRPNRYAQYLWQAFYVTVFGGCGFLGVLVDEMFFLALFGTGLVAVGVPKLAQWAAVRKQFRLLEPGFQLQTTGQFHEAIRYYEKLLPSLRPRERAWALLVLGGNNAEIGEYDLSLGQTNEVYEAVRHCPDPERIVRICIANVYLERGDCETAKLWIEDTDDLANKHPNVAAKLWARDPKQRRRVLELSPAKPPRMVAPYTHGSARALHLIKAFVAELEGETEIRDRNLDLARPAYQGEHDPLVRNWPALREFVLSHPLDVTPTAPSAKMPRAIVVSESAR